MIASHRRVPQPSVVFAIAVSPSFVRTARQIQETQNVIKGHRGRITRSEDQSRNLRHTEVAAGRGDSGAGSP